MEIVPVGSPAVEPIPAFEGGRVVGDVRAAIGRAVEAWLLRTPSAHTRKAYQHDLGQFLAAAGIVAGAWEELARVCERRGKSAAPGGVADGRPKSAAPWL